MKGGFNYRLWLFRSLVAIAVGLMIASFIMPWWTANVFAPNNVNIPDAIRIYGHGLQHDLIQLREYVEADETPIEQTVLAWVYMAVSAGLIMFSTWLKGGKGRWLLGGLGLIYIAYAAIAAFVVISGRLGDWGFSLQGWSYLEEIDAGINASLRFGYYLSYIAGGLCIILALLRGIIAGRYENAAHENKQHYIRPA